MGHVLQDSLTAPAPTDGTLVIQLSGQNQQRVANKNRLQQIRSVYVKLHTLAEQSGLTSVLIKSTVSTLPVHVTRTTRTSRQAKGSMPPNPASSLDRPGIDHRPPPRASSPKYRRLSAPQAPLAVKYSLRP